MRKPYKRIAGWGAAFAALIALGASTAAITAGASPFGILQATTTIVSTVTTGGSTVVTTITTTLSGTTQTDTTTTDTTTTDTTTTETSDEGEGIIVVKPQLSEEAETRLREGVRQALRNPAVVDGIELGRACAEGLNSPDCGLSSSALYIKWEDEAGEPGQVIQAKVAEQVAELLAGTRTLQLPSGVQPLGVTVNYKISLTGFRGRKVDVRWALHRPGGGRLPQDWLKNQRAALLEGEADKDSASPSFWVPLPANVEGPFFIRLTVTNQAGVPLDRANTEPFR
jgi:hypothetical protein